MIIDNKKLQEKIAHVEQGLANVKHLMGDADLMKWFTDDFALRFCWSSNAIEGNTLSLDETVALVEHDEVHAGHTYTEHQDAKNLYHAISQSMVPFLVQPITEEWIKENNRLLRGKGGEYRMKNNRVGTAFETAHIPPSYELVPKQMRDFAETVNFHANNLMELFEKLALSHLTFERIHPFWDGNGRVGRMIMNQQLINHGLLPVALNKNSEYRQAFKQYGKNGDYSKMMYEILKGEEEAIDRLVAFEQKREQGLSWDPKLTLAEQIEEAGKLQAESKKPVQHNREER